jgi:hypothetical protein
LFENSGFAEKHLPVADRGKKAGLGDSWFAGQKATMALQKELNLKFIGPVKTNAAGCPQEQIRHALRGTERGTQVVFEEQDEGGGVGRRTVGWNDHWGARTIAVVKNPNARARAPGGSAICAPIAFLLRVWPEAKCRSSEN